MLVNVVTTNRAFYILDFFFKLAMIIKIDSNVSLCGFWRSAGRFAAVFAEGTYGDLERRQHTQNLDYTFCCIDKMVFLCSYFVFPLGLESKK